MMKSFLLPVILVVLVDWLLLRGTDKLFGSSHGKIRMAIGAILGGIHGALCLMPGFGFLHAGIWRLIILAAAGAIAFEMDIHPTALYCLMNMGLGGLIMCLGGGNALDIALTLVLICALCFIGFQGRPGKKHYVPIQIPTPHGMISVTALVDTGNSLRDPITGQPALVISADLGSKLLGVDPGCFKHPAASVLKLQGTRLIPYSTISDKGLLLAKNFKNVLINGKIQDVLVAFSPMEIGKGKGFNALTGG